MSPSVSAVRPRPDGPPVRMRPGHWVLGVLGAVMTVLGVASTTAGAVLSGADYAQRNGRYLSTGPERFQSPGNAVVGEPLRIDSGAAGWPWLMRWPLAIPHLVIAGIVAGPGSPGGTTGGSSPSSWA